MHRPSLALTAVTFALMGLVLTGQAQSQAPAAAEPASSAFSGRVRGGACVKWDFVGVDVSGRRFYVPCEDHVAVFDLDRATPAAAIPGFKGASAIAVASELHRAFVNDGGALTVFDTRTGRIIRTIPHVGGDGIAYDSVTRRVFPFGDTVHVVDAETLREVGTVSLEHGKPESGAADGTGRVLVALEHAGAVAVIDARTLHAERWAMPAECRYPKTLAVDRVYRSVLVGCEEAKVVLALDAATGRVTGTARLGGTGMDQTGYDPTLHLLVNPSWDHLITLVRLAPDGALTAVDTLRTTEPTHRNVGVDPITHRAFLAVADPADSANPSKGLRPESFGVITLSLPH